MVIVGSALSLFVGVCVGAPLGIPASYPAEWNVSYAQRPAFKLNEWYSQPSTQGGAARWGCYKGFDPNTIIYHKGTVLYSASDTDPYTGETATVPATLTLPIDIQHDQDVTVTLRDGKKIYVDVFRPVNGSRLPTIIVYIPCTKSVPQDPWITCEGRVNRSAISGLAAFESLDPAYWCSKGYGLVIVDPRGVDSSEGDFTLWDRVQAGDGYDIVEWAATQNWSNGKVGTAGVSFLAIFQWFIAETQPPHLAAIAPWSAHAYDQYRQEIFLGGIKSSGFNQMIDESLGGYNKFEQPYRMAEKAENTLINAYWEDKMVDLKRVQVPVYQAGTWEAPVPDAFRELGTTKKWLRIYKIG